MGGFCCVVDEVLLWILNLIPKNGVQCFLRLRVVLDCLYALGALEICGKGLGDSHIGHSDVIYGSFGRSGMIPYFPRPAISSCYE